MSTKTTLKRVALVAVSALGFGLMSVVPSSAATLATAISAGTPAPARVNVLSGATTISLTYSASNSSAETVTAQIVAAPATSTAAALDFTATASTGAGSITAERVSSKTNQLAAQSEGIAYAVFTAAGETDSISLSLNADVAGTYQILVTVDGDISSGFSAGKRSTTYSITTAGAPTSLTLSRVGSVVGNGTADAGAIVKISMKDANGNATVLGSNEALAISQSYTSGVNMVAGTGSVSSATTASLGSASTNVAGVYSVRLAATGTVTAGTNTVTVTGEGLLSSTLTSNISVPVVAASASTAAAGNITLTSTTGYTASTTTLGGCANGVAQAAGTNGYYCTAAKSSHGFTMTFTNSSTTAALVLPVKVAASGGDTYSTTVSIAASGTSGTFSVSQALSLTVPSVVISSNNASFTIARVAAHPATLTVVGTSSVLSATGGSNKFTVEVDDQYGNPLSTVAVSVSVAGRNTVASTALGVTNADGLISYTLADKGTTGTRDTITFSANGGPAGTTALTSVTAVVNYGTVTVDSVSVAGGSKAETVAGSTITDISAADNGPDSTAKSIKATVKDANGNLLAGVPVTFTVDRGAIKKTAGVDYTVVYTDASGVAETFVLGWVAGKQTVTATAGGKSGTDYFTWGQTTPAEARVLSGTVSSNILSYKVVDRFGNPVNGASITLSRTGTGLFGNGASTQTLTTDVNGTADASYSGDATVVAELATTTQGYDKAGEIAATAVTAATAGTTAGIGDTLAPAGVGKVSLAVTLGTDPAATAANAAADAAAEAIDAANAATDAANLAAEAADAATVAAEEARDAADAATAAVEELSTQVATLMAALRAQITTLANTVAKIAKKVRA